MLSTSRKRCEQFEQENVELRKRILDQMKQMEDLKSSLDFFHDASHSVESSLQELERDMSKSAGQASFVSRLGQALSLLACQKSVLSRLRQSFSTAGEQLDFESDASTAPSTVARGSVTEMPKVREMGKMSNAAPCEKPFTEQTQGFKQFGFWRCPMRQRNAPAPGGQNIQRRAQTRSDVIDCQNICWNALSIVPHVPAFLCSLEELRILEFSKQACKLWGVSNLHDKSFLSLVRSPKLGQWLLNCIRTLREPGDEPDLLVKDLGCMEMVSKSSSDGFDCSIKVLRFPDETVSRNSAAVLIVIEPLAQANYPNLLQQTEPTDPFHQVDPMEFEQPACELFTDSD